MGGMLDLQLAYSLVHCKESLACWAENGLLTFPSRSCKYFHYYPISENAVNIVVSEDKIFS